MFEPQLQIREYRAGDLNDLHQIDRICFPGDMAFSRAELLFYLNYPQSIARVALELRRIIGFVVARIENGQAHILTLDVVPDARRRKIGTLLMNELHGELKRRKITVAVLEVSTSNLPAQRLYEGLQYKYLETVLGYYNGREDAYRMARLMMQEP